MGVKQFMASKTFEMYGCSVIIEGLKFKLNVMHDSSTKYRLWKNDRRVDDATK